MDIVIAKIEDGHYGDKPYKLITTTDGKVLKIKQGKDNLLQDKWSQLIEGSAYTLDMGEFTNTEGKTFPFVKNFHKTTISSTTSPVKPQDEGKMGKNDWAEKDRITRESIENQKRADIIANLWIAGKVKDDDPLVAIMKSWLGVNSTVQETSTSVPEKVTSVPKKVTTAQKTATSVQDTEQPKTNQPDTNDNKVADCKAYIKDKQNFTTNQTVDSWLVHSCKIDLKEFDADPEGKLAEVKELMGWD